MTTSLFWWPAYHLCCVYNPVTPTIYGSLNAPNAHRTYVQQNKNVVLPKWSAFSGIVTQLTITDGLHTTYVLYTTQRHPLPGTTNFAQETGEYNGYHLWKSKPNAAKPTHSKEEICFQGLLGELQWTVASFPGSWEGGLRMRLYLNSAGLSL